MRNRMGTQIEEVSLSLPQESDEILIEKACLGDQMAFEHLVHRYRSDLLAFVRRYVTSEEQGEDIVQSVFLQCYLSLPRLFEHLSYTRTSLPLRSWLFRVAINRCIDEARRKNPLHFSQVQSIEFNTGEVNENHSPEESLVDPSPLPEEIAEQQDLQETLRTAINRLPLQFRRIVLLRYTEELTFKEIAQRLQISENTVRTYFRRARPLLRASLVACA